MRGEFIGVWPDTWREIWCKLAKHSYAPNDLFCELYREVTNALIIQPDIQMLADIIDDPNQAKEAFKKIRYYNLNGESYLVSFLENTHEILDDMAGDILSNYYFSLLSRFIEKYSLRYDLRRPCFICPTLPGVFSNLIRDLKVATSQDAHLDGLMKDFENAIRDLHTDCSDGRIKTCIQKQMNLLEAMGSQHPGVTQNTIGRICDQVGTWPHDKIKEAMKNIYGFTCDYPGIRHAGSPTNALRLIEMRDMVAMSILLAGFTPYLTDLLDADLVYRGK